MKKYLIIVLFLILISLSSAQIERYYHLTAHYDQGNFTFRSITVKPLTEDIGLDKRGSYTYEIMDDNGNITYTANFSLKNTFLITPEIAGMEQTDPFEASPNKLEKFDLNIYLPYYPAKSIQLKKDNELLLEVYVSGYDITKRSNVAENLQDEVEEKVDEENILEEQLLEENVELTADEEKKEVKDIITIVSFVILGMLIIVIISLIFLRITNKKK